METELPTAAFFLEEADSTPVRGDVVYATPIVLESASLGSPILSSSNSEHWILAPIAVTIQRMSLKKPVGSHERTESKRQFFIETLIPFLFAGIGLILAGHLLEDSEQSRFFSLLPDAVTLVPTLVGLKGNLEMTLASRLSTLANLGFMDTTAQKWKVAVSNLALMQTQAVVVTTVAVVPAILWAEREMDNVERAVLVAASVGTASLASFLLGSVMILVVIAAHRFKLNPDNITTPVAASLGDVSTIYILVHLGDVMLHLRSQAVLLILILFAMAFLAVLGARIAVNDTFTLGVLRHGWWAILGAMTLTTGSGFVLRSAMHAFPPIAAFQPLINGVGGNLVAVQASRISTGLHRARKNKQRETASLWHYANPVNAFFHSTRDDSMASRLLVAMSLPGNVIFLHLVFLLGCGLEYSIPFTLTFCVVSLIQVVVLLYLCQFVVRMMWRLRVDPDNSAIPVLTAVGDLLGGVLLIVAFRFLSEANLIHVISHA